MVKKDLAAHARKRLEEIEQQADHLVKKLEKDLEELKKHGSPPESMSLPEDFNKGPHWPGLG
jgi:hypothetical protein